MIAWLAAPPSDQPVKAYVRPPSVCGPGALSPWVEPWMTVRVNGAAPLNEPTESCRPAGAVSNVSATVFGSSRRRTVLVRPDASVAVSSSSR